MRRRRWLILCPSAGERAAYIQLYNIILPYSSRRFVVNLRERTKRRMSEVT